MLSPLAVVLGLYHVTFCKDSCTRRRDRSFRQQCYEVHFERAKYHSDRILILGRVHLTPVTQHQRFIRAFQQHIQCVGRASVRFNTLDNCCKFTRRWKYSQRYASCNSNLLPSNNLVQAIRLAQTVLGIGFLHHLTLQNIWGYCGLSHTIRGRTSHVW